jgi:HTH-type transcriptional regulator/antitoxin HigA
MIMKNKPELKPFFATHPGELLLDEMKERKISQIKIANQTGVKASFLNEIIKGKRSIHAHFAISLEKALGIPAEYWLRLQMHYDLTTARAALSLN